MTIFGMGILELVVILLIVLILFGHKSIPKLGKFFGKAARDLKDGLRDGDDRAERESEARESADMADVDADALAVSEKPRG